MFEMPPTYEVNFTSFEPLYVQQSSCGGTLCTARIPELPSEMNSYRLSIRSMNDAGSSAVYHLSESIGKKFMCCISCY